jgi:hypothetical protein
MLIFGTVSLLPNGFAVDNGESEIGQRTRQSDIVYLEGDQTIDGPNSVVFTDKVVYLNGNLTIETAGIFKLVNSTFYVNSTGNSSYVYYIKVLADGKLEAINDSTIRNNPIHSNKFDLEFEIDSIGVFEDSEISDCGHFNNNGILIKSDKVTFDNCILDENYIGLNCQGATPTVMDCIISDSDGVAVLCNNSNLRLVGCELDDSNDLKIQLLGDSKVTLLSTPLISFGVDIYNVVEFSEAAELYITWWLTVQVNNASGPLENATVNVNDYYSALVDSVSTNTLGSVEDIEVTEFIQNSTSRNSTTPHTITITKDDYYPFTIKLPIDKDTFLNRTLELKPITGTIKGYINTTSDLPVQNANVSLVVESEIYWDLTDESGLYTLNEVLVGENYTVTITATINNLSAYDVGVVDNISVAADETTMVNFTLVRKPSPVKAQVISRDKWVDADGQQDVDRDTLIKIRFDYPMDDTTFEGNISLEFEGNPIRSNLNTLDNVTWKLFEFDPLIDLPLDKEFTFTLTRNVLRLTGEPALWEDYVVKFRTEFQPIIDFGPKDGSIGIDPKSPGIYIRVDNRIELDQASLNQYAGLKDIDGNYIPGDWRVMEDFHRAEFVPSVNLEGLMEYTVELSDALVDKAGIPIFRPPTPHFEWSFKTKYIIPEITISGNVIDKDGDPVTLASVVVKDENNSFIGSDFTNKTTGEFSITFNGEPGDYKLAINKKDFKTKELDIRIEDDELSKDLETIELSSKKADGADGDGGLELDTNTMLIILVIIIVIIIIILIAIYASRKPREVPEEEYEEEAEARAPAPTPAATTVAAAPTTEAAATTTPTATAATTPSQYEELAEVPIVTASMYRCPNCGHRLTSLGDCFHCQMQAKYGFY